MAKHKIEVDLTGKEEKLLLSKNWNNENEQLNRKKFTQDDIFHLIEKGIIYEIEDFNGGSSYQYLTIIGKKILEQLEK